MITFLTVIVALLINALFALLGFAQAYTLLQRRGLKLLEELTDSDLPDLEKSHQVIGFMKFLRFTFHDKKWVDGRIKEIEKCAAELKEEGK